MSWVLLTLLAVNFWTISNVIDKNIIGNHIRNPLTYVGIGSIQTLLGGLILILLFGTSAPNLYFGLLALAPGILMFFANLMYIKALDVEEVSRVIPLYSLAVIFTLILATIFLQETFEQIKYFGIFLLIIGSFLISYKHHKKKGKFSKAFLIMAFSSLFYAVSYIIIKYLSSSMTAIGIFSLSEISLGICLLVPFRMKFDEIKNIFIRNKKVLSFRVLSGFTGFAGFLLYFFALSQGPASLITALDLTQSFFVLLYATLISIFIPKILKEELKGSIIALKIFSIILMFVGAYIISV